MPFCSSYVEDFYYFIDYHYHQRFPDELVCVCLCVKGMKSGLPEGPQEGDCSLVRTEAAVKTRRRADASGAKIR